MGLTMGNGQPENMRTRCCYNDSCKETLSYINGMPITEAFAIELGMWLTVTAELITPEGLKVDCKTFCSTECLGEYIAEVTKEYEVAEDRAVAKMQIAQEQVDMSRLRDAAGWDSKGNA